MSMFRKASLSVAGVVSALLLVLTGCGDPGSVTRGSGSSTPPALAAATLTNASEGVAYNGAIIATGGTPPYTYSLVSGSLPGGMTLTKTGTLSGTPTGYGTFTFTVAVVDNASQRASATFTLSVLAPVTITTTSVPAGTVGDAYSATLAASGGAAPYSYAVTAGTLPGGLTLSSAGVLSGKPTTQGAYNFSITATGANGGTATAAYTVTIAPLVPLTISPASLPNGVVGNVYTSTTITAGSGTAPYTFAVTTGVLPDGLTLTTAGVLSGTPQTANTFPFTITATDSKGHTGTQNYSITVTARPVLTITPATLQTGEAQLAYSQALTASNGTAPYTFAVTAGTALPAGLSLSTAGVLSGTPTTAGTYNFSITATDSQNYTGTQAYTLAIAAAGTSVRLGNNNIGVLVNTSANYTLQLSGGTQPYKVTTTSSTLPSTLSLSSAGVITGTPTATGSYTLAITVADSASASSNFNLTVNVVNSLVAVDAKTQIATVPSTFYGLHTSVYDDKMTDITGEAPLITNNGIAMLRYPGGGYSDNYHWAQHILTPFYPSPAFTDCGNVAEGYMNPNDHFGTFVKLLQATNTQAIITVNYGTSVADANADRNYGTHNIDDCSEPNQPGQPQEAAAWVAYANGSASSTYSIGTDAAGFDWKTVGFWASLRGATPLATDDGYNFLRLGLSAPLGIKFWEVGNEMYYNGWTQNINAETDLHAPYIYPNGYSYGGYNSRQGVNNLSPTAYATYAMPFIQAMKAVDPTIQVGLDYDLPGATDPVDPSYNPSLTQTACTLGSFDFAIVHYYPGSYFGGAQPGELLTLPQFDLPNDVVTGTSSFKSIRQLLQQYCSNAASIKVMMTETSPNNSLAPNFPAPVIGLFVLNEAMESLTVGITNYEWLELHAVTSQTNYMDNTYLDSSETPGPSYYGFQLAHLLAASGDTLVSSTATPQATLTSTSQGNISTGIVSYATVKADGTKGIVLINTDSTNSAIAQVTVSGATVGTTADQYSYGVNAAATGTALAKGSFTVPGTSFPVTVPAYTAVELIVH